MNEATVGDGAFFAELRQRFVEVARRRVPEDAVEDLVQEAMAVVFAKGRAGSAGAPPLPWCFQVLRNVIGNHYQKRRTRERAVLPRDERTPPTPLDAFERGEVDRLLREAIDELGARDPACGDLLRRALDEDARPAAPGAPSTGYVRAFRCRQKLKAILLRRGVLP
jgi:DNA-directed RNA polymerase specialized sigma24 family protein